LRRRQIAVRNDPRAPGHGHPALRVRAQARPLAGVLPGLPFQNLAQSVNHTVTELLGVGLMQHMQTVIPVQAHLRLAEVEQGAERNQPQGLAARGVGQADIQLHAPHGVGFFKNVFKVEAVVVKKRYLYMYDNTRIHLDNVKSLGYFLELETLVLNGKTYARRRYNTAIKFLKLDKYEEFRKSYRDLIMSVNK